tara:strand:- start:265 stop:525 length:261 start_codon:yes stop_codon:yes gene_type:complete
MESESKESEKNPVVTHRSQERGGRHRNGDRNWLLTRKKDDTQKTDDTQKAEDTKKEDDTQKAEDTKRKMTPTRRRHKKVDDNKNRR